MTISEKILLDGLGIEYETRTAVVTDSSVVRGILFGAGPTMILVHGLDIGWGQWYSVLPALAKKFSVIALDLPGAGSGKRRPGGAAVSIESDVAALEVALRNWASAGAVVVGHSVGAFAALKLASRNHPMIKKVVAVNSLGFTDYLIPKFRPLSLGFFASIFCKFIYPPNKDSLKDFLEDVMCVKGVMSESFLDYVHENVNRPPMAHPAMLIHSLIHKFRIRKDYVLSRGEIQAINCPVMVIHGELDPLIPLKKIGKTVKNLVRHSLVVMPDTGHVPSIERPERFTGIIMEAMKA